MIYSILNEKGSGCPKLTHLQLITRVHKIFGILVTLVPYLNSLIRLPIDLSPFKAVSKKESGAWLNTLCVSSVGTLLDNECFRISFGIRLGCSIDGSSSRNSTDNDIIKRALTIAEIPSVLERLENLWYWTSHV